jgi:hypothetical protein
VSQVKSKVGREIILEWTQEEKTTLPPRYGCQILLENTTVEQAKDSSFPSDAYLIWYEVDGKTYIDLCRTSKRSSLFDLYYDKFGPGVVKKIDFGYGRVNPKLWGYKQPDKKKRK